MGAQPVNGTPGTAHRHAGDSGPGNHIGEMPGLAHAPLHETLWVSPARNASTSAGKG